MFDTVRKLLALALVAFSACSFLDDFDSLEARSTGGKDGGAANKDSGARDGATEAPDGAQGIDPNGDDVDCEKEGNGTACGLSAGFLCLDHSCVASRCGDGYVDGTMGEQCEPKSMSDGCVAETCRLACEDARDCDDGAACNGPETCDADLHACLQGKPPGDGTACTRAVGENGVCFGGVCAPAGCGNGQLDEGEDCDPSAMLESGCVGCQWECEQNADCDDENSCNGSETCREHTCAPGTALSCDDDDNCTVDACSAQDGCTHALIDVDGDGYSPYACTTPGLKGGDCADDDASRNPGNAEQCDGIDNDCKGGVDDNITTAPCYPDADGDGFPWPEGPSEPKCKCDRGTMFARKDAQWDCYDAASGGASVYPGQTGYFTGFYCKPAACDTKICPCTKTWDYNCDGASSKQLAVAGSKSCSNIGSLTLCSGDGWTDETAAGCGVTASYRTCLALNNLCSGTVADKTQPCH